MGCSNPHPHGQVWSLSSIPTIPATEYGFLKRYAHSTPDSDNTPKGHGGKPCLLCDYAHYEVHGAPTEDGRIVVKNEHWVALVPWWATWPFEILRTFSLACFENNSNRISLTVLPYHRHIGCLSDLTEDEQESFAKILSEVTIRYDNLFECSFAYSMGVHQSPIPPSAAAVKRSSSASLKKKDVVVAPIPLLQSPITAARTEGEGDDECEYAHLHLHFSPPLLRSATVRKFLVG